MARYTELELLAKADDYVRTDNFAVVYFLSKALMSVPCEVVDAVFAKYVFLIPYPEFSAYHVRHAQIGGKDLILFPEGLLTGPEQQQIKLILRETAHCYLEHKSRLEDPSLDHGRQEKEADELVRKWVQERAEAESAASREPGNASHFEMDAVPQNGNAISSNGESLAARGKVG